MNTWNGLGLVLIAFSCLAASCPKPIPPAPKDMNQVTNIYQSCSTLVSPTPDDDCDDVFTPEGYACVNCAGVAGCLDVKDQIYCVKGGCLKDPACKAEQDNLKAVRHK